MTSRPGTLSILSLGKNWPYLAVLLVTGIPVSIIGGAYYFGAMTPQEPRHGTGDLHVDYLFGDIIAQSDGNWTLKLHSGDPVELGKVFLMVFNETHGLLLNTTLANPVNFTFNDLNGDGKIGYGDSILLIKGYEMSVGHLVALRVGNPRAISMMKIGPYGLPRYEAGIPPNQDGTWTLTIPAWGASDINNITVRIIDPETAEVILNTTLDPPSPCFTFNDLNSDGKIGKDDTITFRYSEGILKPGYWVQILYNNNRFTDAYSLE